MSSHVAAIGTHGLVKLVRLVELSREPIDQESTPTARPALGEGRSLGERGGLGEGIPHRILEKLLGRSTFG